MDDMDTVNWMGFANKTDTAGICSVSMVNQGTRALAKVLGFGQSMEVAQAEDDAKPEAMVHCEAAVLLVAVAEALIEMSVFADKFCSMD